MPRFGIGESPYSVNTDENWLLKTSAINRLFELCLHCVQIGCTQVFQVHIMHIIYI